MGTDCPSHLNPRPSPMQSLARRLATAPRRPWPGHPIPITLAITDLDVGGAERALVALATGLDRRRWQPSVACLGPEGALVEPLLAAGIEMVCLDVSRRHPLRAIRRLAGAFRRLRPELVQSFLFHANVASRLAAPTAGRPWVVGGHRVAEREKSWHLTLDRLTSRLAVGSVCVSGGVLRFTRDVGRIAPDRLTVIPNGVDPRPFDLAVPADRAALGVPPGASLALFVGRLDMQKGLPILLKAAAEVAKDDPRWHLVLVGDGPGRDDVRGAAESPNLAGRLHPIGRRDDVPSLLRAADLLVLPSFWEGMPNVVLEAMAARRAVVATSVEGTEDLVVPGATGWLVPPADSDALARALLDAASDPDRLRRFGDAGRARVESEFTPGGVIDAYERLWAGVLGYEIP
jgi:glycosyltransferase involved in cell wall biosynthesis